MRVGEFEIAEPVPALKRPHVLAAVRPWFDAGSVGTLSLARVEDHLQATGLGCLVRPGHFYDFTRYRPEYHSKQGRRDFLLANSVICYSIREGGQDLIFLHLLGGEEMAMFVRPFTEEERAQLESLWRRSLSARQWLGLPLNFFDRPFQKGASKP